MKLTRFKYRIFIVRWDDAESDSSWVEEPHSPLKPTIAVTIGFLIADQEDYVLIADSYFEDPHSKTISNTTKIPRKMIVEMYEYKTNKTRKKKEKAQASEGPVV